MGNKSSSQRSKRANAHGEHVIRLARQLADGNRPGVLATVDSNGTPHNRWMSTLSLQESPHLYALSSPASRKIAHIQQNPHVSRMFTTEMSSTEINLSGTAQIITERSEVNRIWRMTENKTNAYFLSLDTNNDGIAVIDTTIEDVECIVPRYDLHYPAKEEDFSELSAQAGGSSTK